MIVAIDIECSTFAKGNSYSQKGQLVSVHIATSEKAFSFKPEQKQEIQSFLDKCTLLLGFNLKFDVAWLRKLGVTLPTKVYDVQLAHFYITNQQHKLPSLNDVAAHYNIPGKIDVVATEYWDKGIDTQDIPWQVLCEYGEQDVALTFQLYELQQSHWASHPLKHKLFKLACLDLLVLQEMEHNGLYYDEETCNQKSEELQADIRQLTDKLAAVYPNISINFNSNDQLSAFLYGGPIKEERKELAGFFKGGKTPGAPKYKNVVIEHQLPRLFTPIPKTQMAKPGVFSTDEGTLRKLKGKNRYLVDWLLELAKLTKLDETYYKGLSHLNKQMAWPKNYLHGQFNQCIAKTGRLSSSKPNLQNLSNDSLDIFISRFS